MVHHNVTSSWQALANKSQLTKKKKQELAADFHLDLSAGLWEGILEDVVTFGVKCGHHVLRVHHCRSPGALPTSKLFFASFPHSGESHPRMSDSLGTTASFHSVFWGVPANDQRLACGLWPNKFCCIGAWNPTPVVIQWGKLVHTTKLKISSYIRLLFSESLLISNRITVYIKFEQYELWWMMVKHIFGPNKSITKYILLYSDKVLNQI